MCSNSNHRPKKHYAVIELFDDDRTVTLQETRNIVGFVPEWVDNPQLWRKPSMFYDQDSEEQNCVLLAIKGTFGPPSMFTFN